MSGLWTCKPNKFFFAEMILYNNRILFFIIVYHRYRCKIYLKSFLWRFWAYHLMYFMIFVRFVMITHATCFHICFYIVYHIYPAAPQLLNNIFLHNYLLIMNLWFYSLLMRQIQDMRNIYFIRYCTLYYNTLLFIFYLLVFILNILYKLIVID